MKDSEQTDFILESVNPTISSLINTTPLFTSQQVTCNASYSFTSLPHNNFPKIFIDEFTHDPNKGPYQTYRIKVTDKNGMNHTIEKRYSELLEAYQKICKLNDFLLIPPFPKKGDKIVENLELFFH